MKYTLLAIVVACVVIFVATGCSVYYPTSYRAFIPRILDSDYKEYQRLCKEEIGKVVYAREIKLTENTEVFPSPATDIRLGEFIDVRLRGIKTRINGDRNTHKFYYLYVSGFTYYTSWTQKSFSMHGDSKQYITCEPFLYGKTWEEEDPIIIKMALDNKESIGEEYVADMKKYSPYYPEYNEVYRQLVNFKQLKESK